MAQRMRIQHDQPLTLWAQASVAYTLMWHAVVVAEVVGNWCEGRELLRVVTVGCWLWVGIGVATGCVWVQTG